MINTMFMDKMAPGILRLSVMDNDIDLFEGQYPVPDGVSYNSYLIEDEQLCLLDTVDARKQDEWLGGLNETLDGRKLDYLVISHMEPDHTGSIAALCACQPQVKLVANAKTFVMLDQFTGEHPLVQERITVGEGGTLALGAIRCILFSRRWCIGRRSWSPMRTARRCSFRRMALAILAR